MQTIAIVIGVSRYQDLEDLPAAESDAICFARALRNWGIKEEQLFIFLNENATFEVLQQCFETLKKVSEPFKLIFYFCGHGFRSAAPNPKSYLLLANTPYPLEDLIHEIYQLNSSENSLFIDGCFLRINALINPELEMELREQNEKTKSFFCLLSSGIKESFEDIKEEYGYFTRAVLKGLSSVRTKEKNLTTFLDAVYAELKALALPLPEMYNFETHALTFFPQLRGRSAFIAKIQDLLVNEPNKNINLIGDKGIGKTTIGKHFASEKCRTFYTKTLPSNIPLYALIILDTAHLTQLPSKGQWIFLTPHPLPPSLRNNIIEIEIPPLEPEEADILLDDSLDAKTKELILFATKGNPQKIQQILHQNLRGPKNDAEHQALAKAIAAVVASGGYCNEELFALVHEIDLNDLAFIEKIGLLLRKPTGWVPHDYLFEIAQEENLPLKQDRAIAYWCQQLDQTLHDTTASKSLVLALKCFGYCLEYEPYLHQALTNLVSHPKEHLLSLEDGADIYLSEKRFTKGTLLLVDTFLELGLLDKVQDLLDLASDNEEALLRKRQCLWRLGQFQLAEAMPLPEGPMRLKSRLNRGAASFFLGKWDEALKDFRKVFEKAEGPLKSMALCMIGSVLAFSGRDPREGRFNLEISLRQLMKKGDLKGAWVGWNNLGELLWKIGEYRASQFHLEKALELAFCPSTKLETTRNLLELSLRTKGPFAKETMALIETVKTGQPDPYEKMQQFHTLIFAYLLRGEWELAEKALKSVFSITESNPHMHQVTLAYLSLLNGEIPTLQGDDLQVKALQNALEVLKKYKGEYAFGSASLT